MNQKIFAIRDQKADIFMQPFFQLSQGEAERNFDQLVRDQKSTISQYPADYSLYHLGDYETTTGVITTQNPPRHCVDAIHVWKKAAAKAQETNEKAQANA